MRSECWWAPASRLPPGNIFRSAESHRHSQRPIGRWIWRRTRPRSGRGDRCGQNAGGLRPRGCRLAISSDLLKVIGIPSVQSVVGFGGEPVPVPDEEIDAVRMLVGSGLAVAPWQYLRIGQRVRICEGPLSGLEGILAREKSGYRVVINVELLQRGVAVEIDRNFVGTIDGAQLALACMS